MLALRSQLLTQTLETQNLRTNSSATVARVIQSCGNFSPISRALKLHVLSFNDLVDIRHFVCACKAFRSFGNDEVLLRIIKQRYEITAQAGNTKELIRNDRRITGTAVRVIANYVLMIHAFLDGSTSSILKPMYEGLRDLVVYSENVNVTRLLRELSAIKMIDPQLTLSFVKAGLIDFIKVGIKSDLFDDSARFKALYEATKRGEIDSVKALLRVRPLKYSERVEIINWSVRTGIDKKKGFTSKHMKIIKLYEPRRLIPRDFDEFLKNAVLESIKLRFNGNGHGNTLILRLGLSYVVAMPEKRKQEWIQRGFSEAHNMLNLKAMKILIDTGLVSDQQRKKVADDALADGWMPIYDLVKLQ